MQISLSNFSIAEDWHKIKLANSSDSVYINVKQQLFSFAPVLEI
jgi:hypothetical protein